MKSVFFVVFLFLYTFFNPVLLLAQDGFVPISDTLIHRVDYETKLPVDIKVGKFLIGKTEVTQVQFEEIMAYNPSFYKGEDKPVESVSWWEAIQYCNKRSIKEGLEPCYDLSSGECDFSKKGYRLPTNTEWSIASCYTETKFNYDTLTKKGNFGANDTEDIQLLANILQEGTSPVAQYEKNRFGLFDMFGNVWEWCYDFYDFLHISSPEILNDPTGSSQGIDRVIRGGSFVSPGAYRIRPGMTSSMKPDYSSRFTGLRVARSVQPGGDVKMNLEDSTGWFEIYNQTPNGYIDNLGPLPSLLGKGNNLMIKSSAEWDEKRKELKEKWETLLGTPSIEKKPEVNVKVINTYDEDIYWGKLMYLQVEPEYWEKIFLMIPKKPISSPIPVVIVPYYDVDLPAGKNMGGRTYSPKKAHHFAYLAVQHGYIALAVRCYGDSYGENYVEAVANLYIRHPQCSGLGKWVWDAERVVDYLFTLPNVDKNNIGIIGHSLGAKMALYAAAMDERISVAVASEGGIGFDFSNYQEYWYFGKYIRDIQSETDQHELLGLMAPRPFLLIGGDRTDTEKSWYYINAGKEVFNLYDGKEKIGYYNHHSGHYMTPQAVYLAFEWLDHYLNSPK